MKEVSELTVKKRESNGTGISRALRTDKQIPGIIYGEKKNPIPIILDEKILKIRLQDPGFFSKQCELKLENETLKVLPKDIQLHPVKESILHIDFLRVGENTMVTLNVPVKFINDNSCPGIKQGGVLNIVRHEIELKTPVSKIPEYLEANLDGLEIGDSIHISSINLDNDVKPTIKDRDFTVATVAPPTVMKVEEEVKETEEETQDTEDTSQEEGKDEAQSTKESSDGEEKNENKDSDNQKS